MSRRTKVSIICGPLGAGKSSAILKLMQKHSEGALEKGEKWALLVNEIGECLWRLVVNNLLDC